MGSSSFQYHPLVVDDEGGLLRNNTRMLYL
jgi:hypothetical protein